MENNDIQLFTDYLERSLSIAELESFENRLNKDPAFADAFEEFRDIYHVIENQFSPERAEVIKNIQKADSKHKSENLHEIHQKKTIQFKPWQMGIAASILLAIGFFIFNNSGNPSYSDYANPGEIVLTLRSEADSISKKAETTFNSKNYEESISYFDALLEKSPDNSEIQFYKAIALVETNKFDLAEDLLKSLSEGKSVYVYTAVYWQALSKLKQKEYDDAKKILKTIPSNVSEYKKAKEILSQL